VGYFKETHYQHTYFAFVYFLSMNFENRYKDLKLLLMITLWILDLKNMSRLHLREAK